MADGDPFFVVTSTGKGCDPFPCIRSVAAQTYRFMHHHYIAADYGTFNNGTLNKIAELSLQQKLPITSYSPLTVVENVFRYWQTLRDDDVVVWLDGDDPLAHDRVLDHLADVYKTRDPWLTYGSFRFSEHPGFENPFLGTRYPAGVDVREDTWRASHLKTFRAGLVKRVLERDLRRPDGTWTEFCTDRVFMFPMLEMAGERYEALPEVLSVYNMDACKARAADPRESWREEMESQRIHSMPRYARLTEKPW